MPKPFPFLAACDSLSPHTIPTYRFLLQSLQFSYYYSIVKETKLASSISNSLNSTSTAIAAAASDQKKKKMSTLLCATLGSPSVDQIPLHMATAKSIGADIIELDLDRLSNFLPHRDLDTFLRDRPIPTIVSSSNLDALMLAVHLGTEFVDVKLEQANEFIPYIPADKRGKCRVIVSCYNELATPSSEELSGVVTEIKSVGADVAKVITRAGDISDVAKVFQVLVHCNRLQFPLIALCSGERGLISRLLCPKFGGFLTTAPLADSVPGNPCIADFLTIFNIRQLGIDTKVFGLIGNPVAYSKGPIFHNAVFKAVGFNGIYVPLLVDDVASFIRVYSSPDFAGFSCTKPHKEAAVGLCDEVDPVAKSIGAVNTIIRQQSDGKLIGYNTDYVGAISAIEDGIKGSSAKNDPISPLANRTFVVIGAGGAGKALAYGAKVKGAKIVIANRTLARAKELAELVGAEALSLEELETYCPESGMVLANSTSIGMYPKVDETPIPKKALKNYSVVFDAVYTPEETRLLREAVECGAAVVSGVEMFIRQAMGQFELFTGMQAPDEMMRGILKTIV